MKINKTLCSECKEKEAVKVHVLLKERLLCGNCSRKSKAEEVNSFCPTCDKEAYLCDCEMYTLSDAYEDLHNIHDLIVSLFVSLSNDQFVNLPGKPYLALVNQINMNLHEVLKNIKDFHE